MKPPRFREPEELDRAHPGSDPIRSDLRALGKSTERDLPSTEHTAQALWEHNLRASQEGTAVKVLHSVRARPWLATALGVIVVAAVLLAVPVSYTRTTGYEVTLELSGAAPPGEQIKTIADGFAKALDADNVSVQASFEGTKVVAHLPLRPRLIVDGVAQAFAQTLTESGIPAKAKVHPLTEQVTGNVYAMAANEILEIRVNSEGKTDEEIAGEIRTQLEAAGFESAMVEVVSGDDQMKIEIGVECDDSAEPCPPLRVTVDGMEPPEGEQRRVCKLRFESAGMTPEEIEAMVYERLAAMGFEDPEDVDIVIDEDGIVHVEVGDPDCNPPDNAPKAPGDESKTWGEMKKEFR
jgi:hypothetical protein